MLSLFLGYTEIRVPNRMGPTMPINLTEIKQQINERKNQLIQHLQTMQTDIENFKRDINNNQSKALQLQIANNILAKNTELRNEVIADLEDLPDQIQNLLPEQKSYVQLTSDIENTLRLFAENQAYNKITTQHTHQSKFLKELKQINERIGEKLLASENPAINKALHKLGTLNEQQILALKQQPAMKGISDQTIEYLLLELKNVTNLINENRDKFSTQFQNALTTPTVGREIYLKLKRIEDEQTGLRWLPEFKDAHYAHIYQIKKRLNEFKKASEKSPSRDIYGLVELLNEILEIKNDREIGEDSKPAGIIAFIENLTKQYPKAFEIKENKLIFHSYAYNELIEKSIKALIDNTLSAKEIKIAELKSKGNGLIIGELDEENRIKSPTLIASPTQGKNYIQDYKKLLATLKDQENELNAINMKLTYGFLKFDSIKGFAENEAKLILENSAIYTSSDAEKTRIIKNIKTKLEPFTKQILDEYENRTRQINFDAAQKHIDEIKKMLGNSIKALEDKLKNNTHISKAELFEAETITNTKSIKLQLGYLEERYNSTMAEKNEIENGIKERYEAGMECIVMNEIYRHQWETVMQFIKDENPHFIPHPDFTEQLANPNSSQSAGIKLVENYQRNYNEMLFWVDKIINFDPSQKKEAATQTTSHQNVHTMTNGDEEVKHQPLNPFDDVNQGTQVSLNPFDNNDNEIKQGSSSNPFNDYERFNLQSYQRPEQIYEAIDPQYRYQIAIKYFNLLKDSFDDSAKQLQNLMNTEADKKYRKIERQAIFRETTDLIKEILDKFAVLEDTKSHKGIKLMQNFIKANAELEAEPERDSTYLKGLASIAAKRMESVKGIFRQGLYKLQGKSHDENLNRYYSILESLGEPNLSNQALLVKIQALKELNNVLNAKPEIVAMAQERKNNNVNNSW